MASLIIIFPLFILFTRLVNNDVRINPEKREGKLRKWLIYITLFIGGVTIAGDLIALINTFLGGELTTRFLLKIGAILIVVGSVFAYYFFDLRGLWSREEKKSVLIGAVSSFVVLLVLVVGFFITGSPTAQRDLRLDQERVSALQSIQWQITNFWQQKERLPQSLEELNDPLTMFAVPVDPQTGASYRYIVKSERVFALCAEFTQETPSYLSKEVPAVRDPYSSIDATSFAHGVGEVCFERTIDPDKFPPLKAIR